MVSKTHYFAIPIGKEDPAEVLIMEGANTAPTMFSFQTKLERNEPQELASLLGPLDETVYATMT